MIMLSPFLGGIPPLDRGTVGKNWGARSKTTWLNRMFDWLIDWLNPELLVEKIIPRWDLSPGPPSPQSATISSVLSHHIRSKRDFPLKARRGPLHRVLSHMFLHEKQQKLQNLILYFIYVKPIEIAITFKFFDT